jgi:GNAT superfamily N-acetyltransferase
MPRFSDPEALASRHALEGFSSGEQGLDAWLAKHARSAAAVGSARTYVVTDAEQQRVVGYHALTVAEISHADATPGVARGMPRYPIPAVLLARLAVDRSVQGRGLGAFLLRDAMTRVAAAAEAVGIRALLVHAVSPEARSFYMRHGLEPSPTDELHLMISIKGIRAGMDTARRA